jgi:hypothetical protein
MKCTFLLLCVVFFLVSFTLYSNTTFNWKILHTFLANSYIIVTNPLRNSNSTSVDNLSKQPLNQSIASTSRRKFAIFACSIHSSVQAYSFYTPITASSWSRVGYETIVFFVGDFTLPNALTPRLNLSRTYLKYVGAHIIDIQCNSSYAIKLSQLVRLFGGLIPDSIVHDDDDILTGDSDLMPLKASEYRPTSGTDGFVFNAFCCGSFKRREKSYRMFPS